MPSVPERAARAFSWRAIAVGAGLFALLTKTAAFAGPSAPRANHAAGPPRLVFQSTRAGGSWFSMNADGSDLRALRAPFDRRSRAWSVAWSPDASRVAYLDMPDPNRSAGTLFLMQSDGTDRVRLAGSAHEEFGWSQSGRWLAWYSWTSSGSEIVSFATSDGTPAGRLSLTYNERLEGWAPGDRVLLLEVGKGLVTADRDGSHQLMLAGTPRYETKHAWSPVGDRLAYAQPTRDAEMLCVVNADGAGRRCLSGVTDTHLLAIAWSPRGDRVVFSTYSALWLINVATMRARSIVRFPPSTTAWKIAWSPDATKIAASVGYLYEKMDIWVLRPDGSPVLRTVMPGYDDSPRWVTASRLAPFEGRQLPRLGALRVAWLFGLAVPASPGNLAAHICVTLSTC